jgi:hypothetical protein
MAIAGFTAANLAVGGGLYYYISQSEGKIARSYVKKNKNLDQKQYDGRADTQAVFKLNQVRSDEAPSWVSR